jgi:hypothetical protein
MKSKTYMGVAQCDDGSGGCVVHVIDDRGCRPLDPRFDLREHSPTGFNWGYGGSGPAQLALALCADALGDDARAQRIYQAFKFAVVTRWPGGAPWTTTQLDILAKIHELEDRAQKKA